MVNATGTLIASYYVCKRELWFMGHEITPDQDDPFLSIGRYIEENFYKRERKFYDLDNMKIDLVKKDKENILICEVKKSSKYEKNIIMQLSFYLLKLKESGINAKGEILIPKERKKIPVFLTDEIERELKIAIKEIENIIKDENPPNKERIRFCTHCAYREFCWS
ncbi:MAG TPA: CRISPR-associated protein Cas4 [Caldisericia bacterium]|nr:CRISPR-associated protein Cas4 [Caldisericia bacterium]